MTRHATSVAAGLALALITPGVAAQSFDQNATGRAVLRELIETNTTASVGNTTKAAELLAARFRAAGVPPADIAVVGPDSIHKSLVVRLRGTAGPLKPILLLAHLDVVEARREDWSMDPFILTEKDGFFYGRGTQDVKGGGAALVTALLRLRAERVALGRDLILAFTAGEEGDMPNGVEWLLANRKDLIDAEFCVNVDGGGVDSEKGRPTVLNIQAAEKVYTDLELSTTNRGGHSSLPRPDNAIYALARALDRIDRHAFPVQFNEVTRTYFQRGSALHPGQLGADLKAAAAIPPDAAALRRLAADPWYNAQMRTTCVTTMLSGGHAPNALPQGAKANVNCRRLPGVAPESVVAALRRVVADTSVHITVANAAPQSPPSPIRADVEGAARTAAEAVGPALPILPVMETGATDGLFFRNAGLPTYGISGLAIDTDDIRMHGRDERIRVSAFNAALEFTYRLLKALAVR